MSLFICDRMFIRGEQYDIYNYFDKLDFFMRKMKMKKILLLTSNYYPEASANGICVSKIAESLKRDGFDVHLICYRKNHEELIENHEGILVYRIKMPLNYKIDYYSKKIKLISLAKLLGYISKQMKRVKLLLYLPLYPISSILTVFRFCRITKKLHQKNNYDIVLSSYNPIEGVIAASYAKSTSDSLKFILYVLDSFSNTGGGHFIGASLAEKIGWRWEKVFYERSDLIINMRSHEEYHKKARYLKYKNKTRFADIPLFAKNNYQGENTNEEITKLVYTGSLDTKRRNPSYLCDIIKQINCGTYRMFFYSIGDCESMLQNYEKLTNGIIASKGFVDHKQSLHIINSANVLINIGNKGSDMLPSKIFEYMSTGKPIIHVYFDDHDSSLPYLKRYPLSLLIKANRESYDENILLIEEFITQNRDKSLNYDTIASEFEENKPEYTVDIIKKVLQ